MGRFSLAALALVAMAGAWLLFAQEPTFRVDVQLVRLLATVKDNYGMPVGNLGKADFQIFDNGVQQEVSLFEKYTQQPLSVCLLVDCSGSTAKELKYEADSVARFTKALLREGNPEDALALFSFNWEVRQHTGFTRNLQRIEKEMRSLKAEAGTSMYDAIWLSSQEYSEREGRKVMVLVTDGGDTISTKRFPEALEALHRADAVLYSILVMPITSEAGRNIGGENALFTMSQATGGRVFSPSVGAALDQAFDEILRDLRTQYLLGYYPRNLKPSSERFHKVEIKTNRPGLRVVSRSGYYGDVVDTSAPAREGRDPRIAR